MQGLLIVISGFSGVGKGTLVKELLKRYPEDFALSISATTRPPRKGEVNGREYFFVSREEFERRIREGELIEHALYNGNYYGTPKEYVDRMRSSGKNVILEIEMQGGLQIKAKFPETLLLFIVPPSVAELSRRLHERNTETEAEIEARLKRASEETEYIIKYDYVAVNDDFDTCVEELRRIIAERQKNAEERQLMAARFEEEFDQRSKGR